MWLRGRVHEDWETMRRRILRETEEYLERALRNPEMSVRIPTHRVGCGEFPRAYAIAFWRRVLMLWESD